MSFTKTGDASVVWLTDETWGIIVPLCTTDLDIGRFSVTKFYNTQGKAIECAWLYNQKRCFLQSSDGVVYGHE